MSVQSVVAQADTPLDIALVLDSTGSMQTNGKMTQLKSAVNIFLDNFEGASGLGKVQVAMVPFDTDVKVENLNMTMVAAPTVQCDQMSSPDKDYCNDNKSGFLLGTKSGTYTAGRDRSSNRYMAYIYETFDNLDSTKIIVYRTTYSCYWSNYSGCSVSRAPVHSRGYTATKVGGHLPGASTIGFNPMTSLRVLLKTVTRRPSTCALTTAAKARS
ncbi:vWA domain-containing protein [Jiella pelagia]|uniref:VWA domain-containing protein n=1 Tax=Jiella pelagia TaxID=2986949 RepID=A0ABY7BUR8_9HYPH|nr:vWA domain-containing protein [Jiella pelagia]WAP67043.1 VWA domain-containing protein [Jiella pelagia]